MKPTLALERLLFFSDAVMAIAITLLAIELRLPAAPLADQAALIRQLSDLLPHYFAFFISFVGISIYWMSHHRAFRYIARFDGRLVVLNLIFLFFVVQLPFLTSLLGSYGNFPLAAALYASGLTAMALASTAIWRHAVTARLTTPDLQPAFATFLTFRAVVVAVAFAISIPLAFLSPYLAQLTWLGVAFALLAVRRGGPGALRDYEQAQ